MDLKEAVAALMGHADRAEVLKELTDAGQPLYQAIFDKGHAVGYAKKSDDLRTAQEALEGATQRAKALEMDLEKLRAEQPEAAKIHDQYRTEMAQLAEGHKQLVAKLKGEIQQERLSRAQADLKAKLTSGGKRHGEQVLDSAYADVLVAHPDTVKRFKLNDGRLEVLQAGKDIPLQVGEGQEPLDLLAAELKASANPKLVVSGADRGAGESGSAGGAGAGGNFYDKLRQDVKKEQEAKKPSSTSAAERLGMTPGA